jgi:hypothetical protein
MAKPRRRSCDWSFGRGGASGPPPVPPAGAPGGTCATPSGAVGCQYARNRRPAHVMAHVVQGALHPRVAPRRVVCSHPYHERTYARLQPGAARTSAAVGPLPRDQLPPSSYKLRGLLGETDAVLRDGRILLCDRDPNWTAAMPAVLSTVGVRVVRTPPASPNCNAHAERFVRWQFRCAR